MRAKRVELVREFATIMAGYSILLPALEAIADDPLEELEMVEIEALAIGKRIQKLVRSNLRPWEWERLGPPDYFDKRHVPHSILQQYKNGRFAPTPILLDAQIVAEKGINEVDDRTINNFTCGISVFSTYFDMRGGFKNYPVVSKEFLFNASDRLLDGLMVSNGIDRQTAMNRINESMDIAEIIVKKILKSRSDK